MKNGDTVYVITRVEDYSIGYRPYVMGAFSSRTEAEKAWEWVCKEYDLFSDPRVGKILEYGYPKDGSKFYYILQETTIKMD